jgi:hypothetical protein
MCIVYSAPSPEVLAAYVSLLKGQLGHPSPANVATATGRPVYIGERAKFKLRQFRKRHRIPYQVHLKTIREVGWSVDEWEAGHLITSSHPDKPNSSSYLSSAEDDDDNDSDAAEDADAANFSNSTTVPTAEGGVSDDPLSSKTRPSFRLFQFLFRRQS